MDEAYGTSNGLWTQSTFSPLTGQLLTRQSGTGDATTETYYLVGDHLGSVDAIMNAAGAVQVRTSFAAFGARRDDDWVGVPSAAEYTATANSSRRGFTGHEMLDNVGLIHMNGRVYDPAVGRFISADPYIDVARNPQGWNRYSYLKNHPCNSTDPSGFTDPIKSWINANEPPQGPEEVVVTATRLDNRVTGFTGFGGGGMSGGGSNGDGVRGRARTQEQVTRCLDSAKVIVDAAAAAAGGFVAGFVSSGGNIGFGVAAGALASTGSLMASTFPGSASTAVALGAAAMVGGGSIAFGAAGGAGWQAIASAGGQAIGGMTTQATSGMGSAGSYFVGAAVGGIGAGYLADALTGMGILGMVGGAAGAVAGSLVAAAAEAAAKAYCNE